MLRRFIERHIFTDPSATCCVIDPEVTNKIAIRAYEKAGFRPMKVAVSPVDGLQCLLMRLDRPLQTAR
jgi:RimJ/RimL family protein N-acetyltransferase